MHLKDFIRSVEDFPKPGVTYLDITPLLQDYKAVQVAVDEFVLRLPKGVKIDKVVGVESRGFFFATLLAERLQAGLVLVRKAGKLPYDTIAEDYGLEYGKDRIEIHRDAIQPGERVLIHDDVLATGGTALAACKLVEILKAEIVQINFLIEIDSLKGRDKLTNYSIEALMNY